MQMLALRCGYQGQVTRRADGGHVLYISRGGWLTLRSANGAHKPIPREYYEGIVWCPSVPSTFWLARRNGKPFITGNTFPPKLVEPMIKASTSEKGQCPECGAPWARTVERGDLVPTRAQYDKRPYGVVVDNPDPNDMGRARAATGHRAHMAYKRTETGWQPTCAHADLTPVPQTVLDPFGGSGTVGMVAERLGRSAVLCELNPEYAQQAVQRVQGESPMFVDVEVT
jgi:hypothetical protein